MKHWLLVTKISGMSHLFLSRSTSCIEVFNFNRPETRRFFVPTQFSKWKIALSISSQILGVGLMNHAKTPLRSRPITYNFVMNVWEKSWIWNFIFCSLTSRYISDCGAKVLLTRCKDTFKCGNRCRSLANSVGRYSLLSDVKPTLLLTPPLDILLEYQFSPRCVNR